MLLAPQEDQVVTLSQLMSMSPNIALTTRLSTINQTTRIVDFAILKPVAHGEVGKDMTLHNLYLIMLRL